ncbi:FecR family protein [Cytophagaceae bacterium YF14B1]|uniref:FecR family protein n=1 Tax=Xanthocytophaga flava TaxID=3048013 RepID=A0AAE3UAY9_9BACT|nr:FecR family protein [Xanthocytophaga flavus]MDJ1483843.1 FecR family protein [Xanthocytophaga flavus]
MNTYQRADIIALVQSDSFRQWVLTSTPELDMLWQQYLLQNPNQEAVVAQAREIVLALRVKNDFISDTEIDSIVSDTISTIRQTTENNRDETKSYTDFSESTPPFWNFKQWFTLAASFVLLLGIGYLVYTLTKPETLSDGNKVVAVNQKKKLIEKVNQRESPLTIELPDGSRVTLKKNSRIAYAEAFTGSTREVFLTGEAFFDVVKNPSKPFLVYANELVTKVLGTKFRVSAYEAEKHITVEVRSGKVSVYASQDTLSHRKNSQEEVKGVILTPNQKVVFSREEARIEKTLVEKPIVTIPHKDLARFVFEDAPAAQVFSALEKTYSIDLVYDEELMSHCQLTATLGNEPLFEQLTVLCKAIEAKYEVVDGQIRIHSKGCN